jgi:hypothetical protein
LPHGSGTPCPGGAGYAFLTLLLTGISSVQLLRLHRWWDARFAQLIEGWHRSKEQRRHCRYHLHAALTAVGLM